VANIGAMKTNTRRHLAVPRRLPALLLALLVAGSLAAVAPAPTDAYTYVRVSSLRGPVRVDRIVISRVGISLPIRNGVIGAPVYERGAYHYPGTSWPGGHSNTYLYGHARAGTFLKLLADQLKLNETEFWEVQRSRTPATRPSPAPEPAPRSLPA
jgi:hypothetical protein